MTEVAKIPSPSDWDLDWGDVAMIVDKHKGRGKVTALIHRFYITESTAQAWLDGLKAWERSDKS